MMPDLHTATGDSLVSLNAFVHGRALRRFQEQMVACGSFQLCSPYSGNPISPSANLVQPHNGVIYWFDDVTPFALVVSSMRLGNPILALVTATEIHWTGQEENHRLVHMAQNILTGGQEPAVRIDPNLPTDVIFGHLNFAHFLWNEFPALVQLGPYKDRIHLRALFDVFGVIQRVSETAGLPLTPLNSLHEGAGWRAAPSTMIGAEYCSAAALETFFNNLPAPRTERVLPQPALYITLRHRGRTIDGQIRFLTALTEKLLRHYPQGSVVLDGFSDPIDFDRPIYAPGIRADLERTREASKADVAQLIAALPADLAGRVHDITGLPFPDAIPVIGQCRYYISHSGTLQHKVGWLFPMPGTMHGNIDSIRPAALAWTASKVEGSVLPSAPDPANIENTEAQNMPVKTDRNRDYRFLDETKAVNDILAQVQNAIG